MTNFRVGDRIKNICRPKSGMGNYGEKGTVVDIDTDNGRVYVEYDNGDTGHSTNPDKYYQKLNYEGYRAGTTKRVSSPVYREGKNMFDKAVNAVKRMTLSAEDKLLIREGLMTECGVYTESAIAIINQDNAGAQKARLVEVATAMKADRKEDKEAEED